VAVPGRARSARSSACERIADYSRQTEQRGILGSIAQLARLCHSGAVPAAVCAVCYRISCGIPSVVIVCVVSAAFLALDELFDSGQRAAVAPGMPPAAADQVAVDDGPDLDGESRFAERIPLLDPSRGELCEFPDAALVALA
jgi:hypothetical protein